VDTLLRGAPGGAAATVAADRLPAILALNAFGDQYEDLAAATIKDVEPRSQIGVWPLFGMLNHSCVPNVSAARRVRVRRACLCVWPGGAVLVPPPRRRRPALPCPSPPPPASVRSPTATKPPEPRSTPAAGHPLRGGPAHGGARCPRGARRRGADHLVPGTAGLFAGCRQGPAPAGRVRLQMQLPQVRPAKGAGGGRPPALLGHLAAGHLARWPGLACCCTSHVAAHGCSRRRWGSCLLTAGAQQGAERAAK
jgi:hypothetical protein